MPDRRYILKLSCPDRVGIVAAVSSFLAEHQGWIVEAHHHADPQSKRFFMRQEILADSLAVDIEQVRRAFGAIAEKFEMDWSLRDTAVLPRVVILVSKRAHCLDDLLFRWRTGELRFKLEAVIANHEEHRGFVQWHGAPYHHVPVERADKASAFGRIGELLEQYQPELIVLARYMQVLPGWLCEKHAGRIINIHHSFLPSFVGARPYHQAHQRGVKFIGATCHYVTEDLDAGPIIEQDAIRTSHADTVEALMRMGQDVEKAVLARGVRYHLEDRVLLNGRKTVVFD